ncbi:MAG: response regulator [Candidatus Omnitrophica bacterium]|nr:response regulator [Candidatus Omnitrophota bacterium]
MTTATETTTSKAYILVIDDDPLLTRTLKKALEKQGYFVDTAQDGHEGIRKAKSGFFHLVLCDVRMPGLDGIMTIRHIQNFQKKAGIGKSGFIVITAYDTEETRHNAFQLGVTDFLKKPFDLNKFREVIEHNAESVVERTPVEEVAVLNERLERLIDTLHEEQPTED